MARLKLGPPGLVLVTGAGSGIGRATAIEFARHRQTEVVVTDIDELAARETVAAIRRGSDRGSGIAAHRGSAHAYRLDVADPDAWESLAVQVAERHGVPDVLVNNAGIVVGGAFLDHSAADWERQLGVNLFGVIHGCRVVGRQMADRARGGHIVNVASAAAFTPVPSMPAYCVSKAGVKMLSECLRAELGQYGIGVTAICPGFINTGIGRNGEMVGIDEERIESGRDLLARLQDFEAKLPVHVADPSEVARAIRVAVALDLAVVPVRPEAWFGWVMSRVSPGLVRLTTAPFTAARMQRVAEMVPGLAPSSGVGLTKATRRRIIATGSD